MQTDQTECYDPSGNITRCMGSGQDGAHLRSQDFSTDERFHAMPAGVKDRATGLTWKTRAGDFPMTWDESAAFVGDLNAQEHGDHMPWRLPTRRELFSLISHQYVNPALPAGHPFQNVFSGYYWTITPSARLPEQAWYVHLGGGKVYRGMKHGAYLVWAVSGPIYGSTPTENRFSKSGDTVLDNATGQQWYIGQQLIADTVPWQGAIEAINYLNTQRVAGHMNWRLPNIRELESISDDTLHSPAIASDIPLDGNQGEGYWSSTTSVYEPSYAWVLYTQDGAIGVGFKPRADFHTIAVRDEPLSRAT